MADATRYQLAARAVARHRGAVARLTGEPSHVVTYLLGLEGALSEHLRTTDDVRAFHDRQRPEFQAALERERAKKDLQGVLDKMDERDELLALVDDYRALKQRLGLMDFSDQIALAAELAERFPEVGVEERRKFRVVLLDEYQDTSVAQARLLGRLFSGPDAEHGRGHAVTAVGDPFQAIYGWRGASVSNILQIGRTFPLADGSERLHEHTLTVSWRCDQQVLDVANALAGDLVDRGAGVRPVEELRLRPGGGDGEVLASRHESAVHEHQWLVEDVRRAVEPGAQSPRPDRGRAQEIGVLTRDNATAAEVFDALSAADIPVEIVGLSGLLRVPEVSEVFATLTLLHDLTANAALLTLLTGPGGRSGRATSRCSGAARASLAGGAGPQERADLTGELERAVTGADPTELLSLCDALDDPGDLSYSPVARERFGLLAGELRMLRRHAGEPLLDLVRLIIDTSGLELELASSVSGERRSPPRQPRPVRQAPWPTSSPSTARRPLAALLAYLGAEDEMGEGLDIATPTEADSVKLLTVHRAKGLEWDSVFYVGVNDKKFASERGRSTWLTGSVVLPSPLRGVHRDIEHLEVVSTQDGGVQAPSERHGLPRRSDAWRTSPSLVPGTGSRCRRTGASTAAPGSPGRRSGNRWCAALPPGRELPRHWRPSRRGACVAQRRCDAVPTGPCAGSAAPRHCVGSKRPSSSGRRCPVRPTTTSTWSRPRPSRSGTTRSSGCSPRRDVPVRPRWPCRCPRA